MAAVQTSPPLEEQPQELERIGPELKNAKKYFKCRSKSCVIKSSCIFVKDPVKVQGVAYLDKEYIIEGFRKVNKICDSITQSLREMLYEFTEPCEKSKRFDSDLMDMILDALHDETFYKIADNIYCMDEVPELGIIYKNNTFHHSKYFKSCKTINGIKVITLTANFADWYLNKVYNTAKF